MAVSPSPSSFAYKFCHFPNMCVVDCLRQIYYVMHRLPSIFKPTIHLRVHKHLVADGKYGESMDKIKRLITKEVDCPPNVKISMILLDVSKTLATHLLDNSGDATMELLNNKQLEQI